MAEIVLLLLFSLLLALAALFYEQEKANEKLVQDLKERDQKIAMLINELARTDLADMKKELIRLKEHEKKIAYLLERFQFASDMPLLEQVSSLVEKLSRIEAIEAAIADVGFPTEPEKLKESLERVQDANGELGKADIRIAELEGENKALEKDIEDAELGLEQKDGQLASLKRTLDRLGKGTEKPACWADEKTGKPKYIYNTGLTSNGLIVRLSESPPWSEARDLPINAMPFDKELGPRAFLRAADPIFQWSEKNECRFFVRAYDLTGPTEKKSYKRHMRFLESAFYKWEDLDGDWSAQ
jgi:hypothetical protein